MCCHLKRPLQEGTVRHGFVHAQAEHMVLPIQALAGTDTRSLAAAMHGAESRRPSDRRATASDERQLGGSDSTAMASECCIPELQLACHRQLLCSSKPACSPCLCSITHCLLELSRPSLRELEARGLLQTHGLRLALRPHGSPPELREQWEGKRNPGFRHHRWTALTWWQMGHWSRGRTSWSPVGPTAESMALKDSFSRPRRRPATR